MDNPAVAFLSFNDIYSSRGLSMADIYNNQGTNISVASFIWSSQINITFSGIRMADNAGTIQYGMLPISSLSATPNMTINDLIRTAPLARPFNGRVCLKAAVVNHEIISDINNSITAIDGCFDGEIITFAIITNANKLEAGSNGSYTLRCAVDSNFAYYPKPNDPFLRGISDREMEAAGISASDAKALTNGFFEDARRTMRGLASSFVYQPDFGMPVPKTIDQAWRNVSKFYKEHKQVIDPVIGAAIKAGSALLMATEESEPLVNVSDYKNRLDTVISLLSGLYESRYGDFLDRLKADDTFIQQQDTNYIHINDLPPVVE